MSSKRIFITGANGFIGLALTRRLRAQGISVSALVRSPERGRAVAAAGADLFIGDITAPETLPPAVAGCSHAVHLAAWVGEWGPEDEITRTNVGGSENVAAACVAAGVERLVHISSTAVYGAPDALDVDETWPRHLSGAPYHDSKVRAEDAIAQRAGDLHTLILRPSHVFGPESTHFTIRPLRMLARGRAFVIGGGGYHFKPVYIDNLLDAIELALDCDLPSGTALNTTDGYTRTWRELFTRYAETLAAPPRFLNLPRPLATTLAVGLEGLGRLTGRKPPLSRGTVRALTARNSYSSARATELLGWRPAVGWEEAHRRIAVWVRERGGAAAFGA